MMRDIIAELEAHGFPVAAIPPEHLDVLRELSEPELRLLFDLKARLDAASADVDAEVLAHGEIAGAALF
jgi:hypothetical protein